MQDSRSSTIVSEVNRNFFSGAQRQRKGQWAQTEAKEVPSEHEEELLQSEGDDALEQACPGRLRSLLLWRYSRPTWTRSCAVCCRRPCFGRGVGLDGPQRSLPFCDSVKQLPWGGRVFAVHLQRPSLAASSQKNAERLLNSEETSFTGIKQKRLPS